MRLSDKINEYRLRLAGAYFIAARNRGDREAEVAVWVALTRLHTMRSVERVREMEVERGLR